MRAKTETYPWATGQKQTYRKLMKTLDEKAPVVSNEINVYSSSHDYDLSWEYFFTAYFFHLLKKHLTG